jgi:hypothetical protein
VRSDENLQAAFIDGVVEAALGDDPIEHLGRTTHPGQSTEVVEALEWVERLAGRERGFVARLAREVQEQAVFDVLALLEGASLWDAGEFKLVHTTADGDERLLTNLDELDALHDVFAQRVARR